MNASFDQPVGSLDELVTPCQSAFFWTIVIFIGFKIVTKTRDPFGCNLDLPVDPGETKVTPEPPDSYTAYIYIYIYCQVNRAQPRESQTKVLHGIPIQRCPCFLNLRHAWSATKNPIAVRRS